MLTTHGRTFVSPPARDMPRGIALCLSGGGFRAALFHLGAVRRLYEIGLLQHVETITAVSGGTLLAAHLAEHVDWWRHQPISTDGWEARIAAPFRAFAARNLSFWPVLKGVFHPWSNVGVESLARRIESRLTRKTLGELPAVPAFTFCASDLVSGLQFLFGRDSQDCVRPSAETTVGLASAVSACHPVFLRPYTQEQPQRIALVDGGVFDDIGVEPVWQTHRTLLISDSGDVLRPQRADSALWKFFRSFNLIWDRYQLVEQRWLLERFEKDPEESGGAYWSIRGAAEHYTDGGKLPGYSAALARDTIAPIRTDYDAFSAVEAAVLENHGYLLVNAAAHAHLATLTPYPNARLIIPHPAWMPDRLVREALRDSSRKRLFGRGFWDFRGEGPVPAAGEPVPDSSSAIERPTAEPTPVDPIPT